MQRKAAVAVFALILLMAPMIAMLPFDSIANRLGAPDKNIEANNCYCHRGSINDEGEDTDVFILLQGPDEISTNGEAEFTVTIQDTNNPGGQPDEGATFGFSVDMDGRDLGGGSVSSPMGTASGDSTLLTHDEPLPTNTFNFTLVGPDDDQTIEIIVTGLISNDNGATTGDRWNYIKKEIKVKNKRDIELTATVTNDGGVVAKDILVEFFVDGVYVANQTIDAIEPGSNQNVSATWDATFASIGDHEIKIVIKSDHEEVDLDQGNNIIIKMITIKPEKEEKNVIERNQGLIIMVVAIVAILGGTSVFTRL